MNILEFGKILKALREKSGFSTHMLAEASGVSQSYISHLESGRKKNIPSPEILKKLAEALNVTYYDLMAIAGYYEGDDLLEPIEQTVNEVLNRNEISISKKNTPNSVDLMTVLQQPNLTYKNEFLTKGDRRRILDMLNVLFPET